VPSHVDTWLAVFWIEMDRDSGGAQDQSNDFPLIMLWCEPADDLGYDEEGASDR
jgi:hypothetical protein